MNKHTRGLFIMDAGGLGDGGHVYVSGLPFIEGDYDPLSHADFCGGNAVADALLYRAAPDLLTALEHMLGACDPTVDREDDEHFDYADAYIACDAARAAIAKARGQE